MAEKKALRLQDVKYLKEALEAALIMGPEEADQARDHRTSPLCYPGLRSFMPEEGSLFFGRDESLAEVQDRLEEKRTLVVLGGSGSGKSSLIRAGILPYLNSTRRIRDRDGIWFWAESRPRTAPLEVLKRALLRVLNEQVGDETHDLKKKAKHLVDYFDAPDEEEIADSKKSVLDKDDDSLLRHKRAKLLSGRLLDFTKILDEIDIAENGIFRKASVNLMLLIDQFEEIFRPEVDSEKRQEFLDFLVFSHGRIEEAAKTNPEAGPGLFLVLTMRSEELHRCAEHVPLPALVGEDVSRSLTDLVNKSFYLLRLLRPKEDRADLKDAILKPVRAVLSAYEFPEPEDEDYPYEKGLPAVKGAPGEKDKPVKKGAIDWLLDGAANLTTEHQPDQLPLLQHALRQMWLNAVRELPDTFLEGEELPRICKKHMFSREAKHRAQAEKDEAAKLEDCLNVTADNKAGEARQAAFPDQKPDARNKLGDAVLKAMFRALVRRDDRSNWARRFGTVERMQQFLARDPDAASLGTDQARGDAIRKALEIFTSEGFVQKGKTVAGKGGRPGEPHEYDISHEALIRNWKTCQEWLRPLETVANALKRAVEYLNPGKQAEAKNNKKGWDWLVPQRDAVDLAPLVSPASGKAHFPRDWALDEVKPLLGDDAAKGPWSPLFPPQAPDEKKAEIVLDEILKVRRKAENERRNKKLAYGSAYAVLSLTVIGVLGAIGYLKAYDSGKLVEQTEAAVFTGIIDQANAINPSAGNPPLFGERALELRYSATLLETDTKKGQPGATELGNHVVKLWNGTVELWNRFAALIGQPGAPELGNHVVKLWNGTVELWNRFAALIFGNPTEPAILEQNDKEIPSNKVRPRAVQFWDGIVREMYGYLLFDGKYVDIKDADIQGGKCINVPSVNDFVSSLSNLKSSLSNTKYSLSNLKSSVSNLNSSVADVKSDVATLELKGLDGAYEVRLSYNLFRPTIQFEVNRKGDVESQKGARHQSDPRDYILVVFPGDQVCLSNDARMMAWVRQSSDVHFVEINWSIRDKQLVPIVYPIGTPNANRSQRDTERKQACIQGFLSKNFGGTEIQGVLYDRSSYPKNCPATIEQGPKPAEPEIIRSVHFQSLNHFSSFSGDTKDKQPCNNLKDKPGDWHELTQDGAELHSVWACGNNRFVAIAKPPNSDIPSASAAIHDGETKYRPVKVPVGDPGQITHVFLDNNGHAVLQTEDNLKFMLLVGIHKFKDVLSTVKPDPDKPPNSTQLSDDMFSEPCKYLPGCKNKVSNWMLSGADAKADAAGSAKDQYRKE